MSDNSYERWAELADREAAGETLTQEELEFCRRFERQNPASRAEIEFLRQLGTIETDPDDRSHELVELALKKAEAKQAEAQSAVDGADISGNRNWIRIASLAAAAIIVVAGAAVGLRNEPARWIDRGAQQPVVVAENQTSRVELVYVSGQVLINGKPGKVGYGLLTEGNTLEVVCGSACVAIDPGIDVCMGERGRVKLARVTAPERRLELMAGRLTAVLKPQPKGSSFSVSAGDAVVTAVGTAFSVDLTSESGGVETTVLSGKVSFSARGATRMVVAHQQASLRGFESRVTSVVRAEESRNWALVRPSELWQEPSTAVLDLPGAPGEARVILDGRPIGAAPLASLIPVGSHLLEVKVGEQTLAERTFTAEAGQIARVDLGLGDGAPACQNAATSSAPASSLLPPAGEPESAAATVEPKSERNTGKGSAISGAGGSARDRGSNIAIERMMGQARTLMQQYRWAEAARAYRDLEQAFPQSAEAQIVLVPLGQLELNHLERPDLAVQLFDRYLRQGEGLLAQEARSARISALRELGRTAAEAEAIEEFLSLYPNSFEAAELRDRLGAIQESAP